MGEYDDSPYPYWITFRGLTERYGVRPGRGEDVMQRFWELTSKNQREQPPGARTRRCYASAGARRSPSAYHAYAVAVKFNERCGGGYVLAVLLRGGTRST